MKEKRGRAVDTYLLLVGNYSLRSTDHLAVPHLSSLSSAPSICVVRSENMKRRGAEKRREEKSEEKKEEEKNEIEEGIKPGHVEDIPPCFQCVVDSFVCCISH